MKKSFEKIYQENKQAIYGYLYYMAKDVGVAEDLCQETFLKIYLNLRKFKGECSEKTWCMIIARNTFLSWAKKRQPLTVEISEEVVGNSSTRHEPESEVICKEKGEFIRRVLGELKEEYRTVLILRDYEGLSYKEIGIVTGLTEARVKINIYRAREQYKKIFIQLGGEENGV